MNTHQHDITYKPKKGVLPKFLMKKDGAVIVTVKLVRNKGVKECRNVHADILWKIQNGEWRVGMVISITEP